VTLPDYDQPSGELSLTVTRRAPGAIVLHVGGDLDLLTAPGLNAEITKLLTDSPDALVLDLSAVPFFGSSALAVLIQAADAARTRGIRLLLVASNRPVLRPLEVTQTMELFSIHDSVEAALGVL
jgi:anti-sigma B factor antagonist